MKKLSLFLSASLMSALLFNSCSVERRYHRTGLNINWNHASVNIKKSKTHSDVATEDLQQEDVAVIRKAENNVVTKSTVISNEIVAPESKTAYTEVQTNSDLASINDEMVLNHKSSTAVDEVVIATTKNNTTKEISKKDVVKHAKSIKNTSGGDVPLGLLYVLCILIPFVAVGLATDWDVKTVIINLLWCLLCGLPGIIHAFIVVSRNK
jgi:uncharacterized membrane protein YqaE (UPF0057 family)